MDRGMSRRQLEFIAGEIQSWLDYQKKGSDENGSALMDDTHLMSPPFWPTRGVLKNWVEALKNASEIIGGD